MADAKHTPGPTALEICQRQRDEIRAERDAAIAEVARLRAALDIESFPLLTVAEVNELPEAANKSWPMGYADAFVKVLKAALLAQRRQHAKAVEAILNNRAAIAKATGSTNHG